MEIAHWNFHNGNEILRQESISGACVHYLHTKVDKFRQLELKQLDGVTFLA